MKSIRPAKYACICTELNPDILAELPEPEPLARELSHFVIKGEKAFYPLLLELSKNHFFQKTYIDSEQLNHKPS